MDPKMWLLPWLACGCAPDPSGASDAPTDTEDPLTPEGEPIVGTWVARYSNDTTEVSESLELVEDGSGTWAAVYENFENDGGLDWRGDVSWRARARDYVLDIRCASFEFRADDGSILSEGCAPNDDFTFTCQVEAEALTCETDERDTVVLQREA